MMKLIVLLAGMLVMAVPAQAADDFPLADDVSRAIAWSYICEDWIRESSKPPTNLPAMPTFRWAGNHCYEELEAEIIRLQEKYKDPVNAYALHKLLGIYKD